MTHDQWAIIGIGAAWAGAAGLLGLGFAWVVRHRSFRWQVGVVALTAVLAVVAGVVGTARAMFLSDHDLQVVLLTISASAVVSLIVGIMFGRRVAAQAMWAASAEKSRRDLVAWVSHDLRTPLAGLRAMAEALEEDRKSVV